MRITAMTTMINWPVEIRTPKTLKDPVPMPTDRRADWGHRPGDAVLERETRADGRDEDRQAGVRPEAADRRSAR